MSDAGENSKYKWTQESTTLLVSVWTDRQVQKQLEFSSKPQLVWESVSKYMCKKGYNVTAKQCRSRMKHILVCYKETKKTGTGDAFEQHYENIDKVFKNKKFEHVDGIDTVDSNVKSPPKHIKTSKNMQMRYKNQQPVESVYRSEVLSTTWDERDAGDYPDSPESNETVLAQPFRVMSPVRDASTNTRPVVQIGKKAMSQKSASLDEVPIIQNYRVNTYPNNGFSDIPFQNTVQNVQNQIIQENMQQNQTVLQQNLLQNQLLEQNRMQMNPAFRQNLQQINQTMIGDPTLQYLQNQAAMTQNLASENVLRMQNQQNLVINNRAMPQEPRKNLFTQNLATTYRQYQDALGTQNHLANLNQMGILSPSISPDFMPNLNDALCRPKNNKIHNLNETFIQPSTTAVQQQAMDATTMTNNATFNDDTISIEFLQESRTPSEDGTSKSKEFVTNNDDAPNAPFRKKKAQKLEQIMASALNSQTDVVNKILAAQNDMVNRFLDLDRDRQNRLENRLDHLLDVVQATVLNKSSEKDTDVPPPVMPNLVPPPKPGVVPPKLDLVPPKPCRVPCTTSNGNFQTANQNPGMTKPGVISPVMRTPTKKIGAIWTKLGPVSQSPFVRAQQQLGFRPIPNAEVRTKSSAERRIARELETGVDTRTLIFETNNFLEAERELVEKTEDARIEAEMAASQASEASQVVSARKKLFSQKEPTAAMILTEAFLEAECQSTEILENGRRMWERTHPSDAKKYGNYYRKERNGDKLLAINERESYECFRRMNLNGNDDSDSCNTSTPAKVQVPMRGEQYHEEPRQTIQQLAQLVMNSARWRNASSVRHDLNVRAKQAEEKVHFSNVPEMDGNAKALDWLQDKYCLGKRASSLEHVDAARQTGRTNSLPMGFTTEYLNRADEEKRVPIFDKHIGFVCDEAGAVKITQLSATNMNPLEQLQQLYAQRQQQRQKDQPFMTNNGNVVYAQNRDLIDRYMQELYPTKRAKDTKETESDDEEFLDTTNTLYSPQKKGSLLSLSSKKENGCILC